MDHKIDTGPKAEEKEKVTLTLCDALFTQRMAHTQHTIVR